MLWVSGWYMSWLISYHHVRSFCRVGLGFHQPLLHSEWWNCPMQFRKRTPPRQSSSHHPISALLFSSLVSHCSTPKQRFRYIKPHARSSPWNFPKASSGHFTWDMLTFEILWVHCARRVRPPWTQHGHSSTLWLELGFPEPKEWLCCLLDMYVSLWLSFLTE